MAHMNEKCGISISPAAAGFGFVRPAGAKIGSESLEGDIAVQVGLDEPQQNPFSSAINDNSPVAASGATIMVGSRQITSAETVCLELKSDRACANEQASDHYSGVFLRRLDDK